MDYYTQSRSTKLGIATITLRPEGDLVDATVTISYADAVFKAEGIFSTMREAWHWAYGIKQALNDGYAGYTWQNDNLVASKPGKGKVADIISVRDALRASQADYDNFSLAKSTTGDKVSMAAIKTSTLLSDEEKATMAALFAKLGKVSHA